jgi:hypothetical protein
MERTDAVLHRYQQGPKGCKSETLRSQSVRTPIPKQMNNHVLIAIVYHCTPRFRTNKKTTQALA